MMIFIRPLILFCVFISPVRLQSCKLEVADFNSGRTVFKNDVHLSKVAAGTFEIKSTEGKRTFRMWDFLTMIGSFVEFDVTDLNLQVRCVFEFSADARLAFSLLKPTPQIETRYPFIQLSQIFEGDDIRTTSNFQSQAILRGTLADELKNRFIVYSKANKPVIVFSAGRFNVSPVFSFEHVVLVIQVFDIKKQQPVMLKFLILFDGEKTAKSFYEYVTQGSSCIDRMIPVDISDRIEP